LKIIESISDKHTRVLLVGHNPTTEEVIEMLTDSLDIIRMPPLCFGSSEFADRKMVRP
jgi:phosphohistidine phosphatase SixA